MNKGVIGILLLLVVGVGIYATSTASKVNEYQKKYEDAKKKLQVVQIENKKLDQELKGKERNTEVNVKKDTEGFLRAFFVYDTAKGERAWTKIKPFATENALKMLVPAGTDMNQPIEKTEPNKTIVSDIDKLFVYYTPVDTTHANVFARVWQKITVNGVSSVTQMPLDISLLYDEQKNRWVVDEMKIQQPLKEDGYIN
ncbi:hypothetical protein P4G85_30250 [Bacillus cereus]|uniref:Uncharacterized protein n=2 Tax=Bacillus cereus group TaxID=86661 RepID=A0A9W5KQT4_BACCE|nr:MULTISPECIES: hypothetical protein [Bacillus cereus group]MEB8731744.1 hypothetical protein [Bacillus cereus]EEM44387.1 hypothetical protein bthur0005_58680 [Bacillus thuringiensis serovar pakistani str. T13001]EJR60955.1 hypothetical protein IK5_06103 [Bacillus cereus VD154]KIU74492.1 hypothetical protein C797_12006 [Bacillus thuringiensis Sbt003]MEB8752505.1 hypothetical protein [Bacillus cereus]